MLSTLVRTRCWLIIILLGSCLFISAEYNPQGKVKKETEPTIMAPNFICLICVFLVLMSFSTDSDATIISGPSLCPKNGCGRRRRSNAGVSIMTKFWKGENSQINYELPEFILPLNKFYPLNPNFRKKKKRKLDS